MSKINKKHLFFAMLVAAVVILGLILLVSPYVDEYHEDMCNINPNHEDCVCEEYCSVDEDIEVGYTPEKVEKCYNYFQDHFYDIIAWSEESGLDPGNVCIKAHHKNAALVLAESLSPIVNKEMIS